ncbi:sensor histidine kinase [Ornithinimicrobium avium]|uniref:histidine kinase n=1 Tax=Ornithinimicrobium avium TaxID=2283195 RepID=A0A345NP76_9MICO|nr:histidine kinase [Ornithinimicrobium avium]AXH96834.1 sensor histidine kinase [Ornithinimicrobium avium]
MTVRSAPLGGPGDLTSPPPLPGAGPAGAGSPWPAPAPGPARPVQVALRRWREGWWAATGLVLGLFTALLAVVVVVLGVAGLFSLPAVGTGILLLVPALWGGWLLSRLQHGMLLVFAGVEVGPPLPSRAPTWRRALGLDEPRLRSFGWAALHGLWGLLAGSVVLFLLVQGLTLLALPLVGLGAPDEGSRVLGLVVVSGPTGYALGSVVGLLTLLVVPWVGRGMTSVDIALARWLLGDDPQRQLREMSRRVATLTTSREETIDSVESERRRIERDLHDGPQQRLVAIAMNLGLARSTMDSDPEGARVLIDEAHASSKEAIVEMRQVARGIVPPILTDRGLDAAVSALAARSPIPVTVEAHLARRPDPTVEAIAYFCVSESLTNAAKHSGARHVGVRLDVVPAPRATG